MLGLKFGLSLREVIRWLQTSIGGCSATDLSIVAHAEAIFALFFFLFSSSLFPLCNLVSDPVFARPDVNFAVKRRVILMVNYTHGDGAKHKQTDTGFVAKPRTNHICAKPMSMVCKADLTAGETWHGAPA